MNYRSTRNKNLSVSPSYAIANGISTEGGLFVPENIPYIEDKLDAWKNLDYIGRAKEILKLYLTDFTDDEISYCVENAYRKEKFEGAEPVKLSKLNNGEKTIFSMELWHGPTCAFKDMALQLLPYLLSVAVKKNYNNKKVVILVATSGDTGKAALEGFKDVENTKICVFYPNNGVSPMQLRQMVTQEGSNVNVCAVEGNFDDCQTAVKKIFTDKNLSTKLADSGMMFSSANSINWGRLLPQIVYYVSSYLDLVNSGELSSIGDKINVVVPTGNFGNILAAYYAKCMGVPINKLICASNANNVLTDFIRTGLYNKNREFFTTCSPSMDILVSSNLERLLYHLSGEDDEMINNLMNGLATNGSYEVNKSVKNAISELFDCGCCNDEETLKCISYYYSDINYLLDTHTAVAFKVYDEYADRTGDYTPAVIASAASPYKFSKSVLSALGKDSSNDEFATVELLSSTTSTPIPASLFSLKDKKVRFTDVIEKDLIMEYVVSLLGLSC